MKKLWDQERRDAVAAQAALRACPAVQQAYVQLRDAVYGGWQSLPAPTMQTAGATEKDAKQFMLLRSGLCLLEKPSSSRAELKKWLAKAGKSCHSGFVSEIRSLAKP